MSEISCVIVEDDVIVSEALQDMLNATNDLRCVAVFADEEQATKSIPVLAPQIVLMDLKLGSGSGINIIRNLKPKMPDTQFLVITIFEENEKVFESLKAGATGYIVKSSAPEEYIAAIRCLLAGGSPLSPVIARKLVNTFGENTHKIAQGFELTERERQIIDLLAAGLMYKQVAEHLSISIDTVRTHIRHIYEKLQVKSRTEALNKIFPRFNN
jgi:two-component system, NarL family, response regulator LiaR